MQDSRKAVWSIPYVSVAFFPNLKQNFIAYRSSKVSSRSDCIFEIQQLWQSGFSRVYSTCCCSYSFEGEILKIGQSSHKMYSNNILNFQESTTILNACAKISLYIYIYIYIYIILFSYIPFFFFFRRSRVKNPFDKFYFSPFIEVFCLEILCILLFFLEEIFNEFLSDYQIKNQK